MSEYPSYLVHYGAKGQKWGIRKYQNEDGTLTAEGKLRYRKSGYRDWSSKSSADKGDALIDRANKGHPYDPYYRKVSRAKRHAWGRFIGRDITDTITINAVSFLAKTGVAFIRNNKNIPIDAAIKDNQRINAGIDTMARFTNLGMFSWRIRELMRDYKSINKAQDKYFKAKK